LGPTGPRSSSVEQEALVDDAPPSVPGMALVAARAADDKQGEATVVLAMAGVLGVTDAFVVTSGRNGRHVEAIVEEVEAACKRHVGRAPLQVEGLGDRQWVLMDYGDVVVHVFDTPTRGLYDLERLWGDAPRVPWETAGPPGPI
jgi:ribosome-associated protein